MTRDETIELFRKHVVPNYGRYPVVLDPRVRVRTFGTTTANRYLDFFPGWGCNLLGHCPPPIVRAVQEPGRHADPRAEHLVHGIARALGRGSSSEQGFGGQAFFCNSGAEANETAIKPARLHTPKQRYKIITFRGGFHGRTIAATSATAQPKYHEGIGPLLAGFMYSPFGDLDAVARLIDKETAAIARSSRCKGKAAWKSRPPAFLAGLPQVSTTENGLLLMFDEVQTGCGRTGHWFAYQHFGVTPDIMTLAKALCGGIAGGALLTTPEIALSLRPGLHAATFGGNPIAARAGVAAIEMIEQENLLEHAQKLGEVFHAHALEALRGQCNLIRDVRVLGLMIGVELTIEGAAVVKACLERRLLINCTQGTVLRLLPAMNAHCGASKRRLRHFGGGPAVCNVVPLMTNV